MQYARVTMGKREVESYKIFSAGEEIFSMPLNVNQGIVEFLGKDARNFPKFGDKLIRTSDWSGANALATLSDGKLVVHFASFRWWTANREVSFLQPIVVSPEDVLGGWRYASREETNLLLSAAVAELPRGGKLEHHTGRGIPYYTPEGEGMPEWWAKWKWVFDIFTITKSERIGSHRRYAVAEHVPVTDAVEVVENEYHWKCIEHTGETAGGGFYE